MENSVLDKFNQYLFVKDNLYKNFYTTPEEDRGTFVDTTGEETGFDRPIYVKFKSVGTIGDGGPENHFGEHASYRMYIDKDGNVELLFENSGHVDEIKDFKHLLHLLDPKTIDLNA